ncbi:phosphopyruvate hydratase family protein [Tessaracoccus coleopterorum]|uniref:hypothetical protein n=1 Tax=Tessaracoccus coleopterorum TaxID=2714950 RepID=UPI002F914B98
MGPARAAPDPHPASPDPDHGGGAHAAHRVAVQDFMVYPIAATTIADALSHVAEVYLAVGDVMLRRGEPRGVADEGGHWPEVAGTRDALQVLVDGMELAGLRPGVDIAIALDIAATQFLVDGAYRIAGTGYPTGSGSANCAACARTSRSPRSRTRPARTIRRAWHWPCRPFPRSSSATTTW